jgi:hypothetical protein
MLFSLQYLSAYPLSARLCNQHVPMCDKKSEGKLTGTDIKKSFNEILMRRFFIYFEEMCYESLFWFLESVAGNREFGEGYEPLAEIFHRKNLE